MQNKVSKSWPELEGEKKENVTVRIRRVGLAPVDT